MGSLGGFSLLEAAVLLLVAGAVGAAAAAWRAARLARRAAEASADQVQTLRAEVRRAVHDLNNPLAAAAIHAELLCLSCPENEDGRRLAEKIQEQIERAKESVAQLSALGRPAP